MNNIKKEIAIFLGLLLTLSVLVYAIMYQSTADNVEDSFIAILLVYCPFLAAILTRLITERNIRKLGWEFGKGKYLIIALLIPILYGTVVYSFAWLTNIGIVNKDFKIGLGSDLPQSIDLFLFFLIGLLVRAIGSFGEEVGWRGFLTPRLYKLTNLKTTSLIVGGIWLVWHIPLMIMTNYGGEFSILKIAVFAIGLMAISYMLTWLRIKSGSLWIGVFCHASHNFFIQNIFDEILVENTSNPIFLTELVLG